jgi:hypothetical protein
MKQNYSEADIARLTSLYNEKGNAGVPEIAEALGKPVKSIVGKLVNLKLYKPDEKVERQPKVEGPTKKDILAELAGLVPFKVDGLAPAKKEVIQGVLDFAKSTKQEKAA